MTRKAKIADFGSEVGAFVRALTRENLSPNTIASYEAALCQLAEFLAAHGYPTDIRRIEARYIDAWIRDLLVHQSSATARNRFRGARRFFEWFATIDDSFTSPMRRMRPPRLPEYERSLEPVQQRELLRACRGQAFEDRRDMALVRLFVTTGVRRAEIANLRYSPTDRADRDLDLNRATARIVGKDQRGRIVRLDSNTVASLNEYLRARREHPHAQLPWLWLAKKGRLDDSGVGRALHTRGLRAGIPDLHRLGHGLWTVKRGSDRRTSTP